MVKCEACDQDEKALAELGHYKINTINGHSCCECCDGQFCFRCGAHPVELVGEAGVCQKCDLIENPMEKSG